MPYADGLLSFRPHGGLLMLKGCWLWRWWLGLLLLLWWTLHPDTDQVRAWNHDFCPFPHYCWSVAGKTSNNHQSFIVAVLRKLKYKSGIKASRPSSAYRNKSSFECKKKGRTCASFSKKKTDLLLLNAFQSNNIKCKIVCIVIDVFFSQF